MIKIIGVVEKFIFARRMLARRVRSASRLKDELFR